MTEAIDVLDREGILAVETFAGQNIEELGEFGKVELTEGFRRLLEPHNERVEEVETDRSLLIKFPEDL